MAGNGTSFTFVFPVDDTIAMAMALTLRSKDTQSVIATQTLSSYLNVSRSIVTICGFFTGTSLSTGFIGLDQRFLRCFTRGSTVFNGPLLLPEILLGWPKFSSGEFLFIPLFSSSELLWQNFFGRFPDYPVYKVPKFFFPGTDCDSCSGTVLTVRVELRCLPLIGRN